ncbi:hypothetical protein [Streptomyces odonnellii]|uniref:hypothetical protein n=1 Tax=Streptomyces odonnellii TaxID=1417980 RepID=UPI000AEC889F|nr:hypothetical protein [Streptomyces odonnellii]
MIISDTLFKGDLDAYTSEIPDDVGRLACGNSRTPEYFADVIRAGSVIIIDMRVLPSNADVATTSTLSSRSARSRRWPQLRGCAVR